MEKDPEAHSEAVAVVDEAAAADFGVDKVAGVVEDSADATPIERTETGIVIDRYFDFDLFLVGVQFAFDASMHCFYDRTFYVC